MLVADMTERAVVVCVCVQGQGQVEQTQTSSSLTSSGLVAFAQPANPFRGLVVLVVDQLIVVHLSALPQLRQLLVVHVSTLPQL